VLALFGKTIDLLSHMLDFRAARHEVIVSDIVNLNTAGYKPKELIFSAQLAEAAGNKNNGLVLARTAKNHLPLPVPRDNQFQVRETGDKVDIDREMTNLAENNIMYNATAELLARKFKGLATVLKETR